MRISRPILLEVSINNRKLKWMKGEGFDSNCCDRCRRANGENADRSCDFIF